MSLGEKRMANLTIGTAGLQQKTFCLGKPYAFSRPNLEVNKTDMSREKNCQIRLYTPTILPSNRA